MEKKEAAIVAVGLSVGMFGAFVGGFKFGAGFTKELITIRLEKAMGMLAPAFASIVQKARDEDLSDDEVISLLESELSFIKIVIDEKDKES